MNTPCACAAEIEPPIALATAILRRALDIEKASSVGVARPSPAVVA